MITRRIVRALDDRLRFAPLARKALGKVFPDQWSFMLGEIAIYSFITLVATGIFLTLFFQASSADTVYNGRYRPLDGQHASAAFASTVSLSFDVRAGLLMRQTHHWTALVFIGAIVLHLLRIFFTGAFRKPREINWLIGVTMLALSLLNGFTGYSMPDDLLSGTGLRIAYSVVESIPIAGGWLAFLLFGGEFPADPTIPRLYISHVLLVPALLAALIIVHMAILIKQKHSQFPAPGRTEHNVVGSRMWPTYAMRTLGLFGYVLAVLFALGGLFQINPVWIYGPFEPSAATSPAQPDWFVAWEEGALRLFPPADFRIFGHLVPGLFFPGVVLGAFTFLALYCWPFLEARRHPDRAAHQLLDPPRKHPARLGFGVATLFFYGLLTIAAADDVIARFLHTPVTKVLSVVQILVLTLPWPAGLAAFALARALNHNGGPGMGSLTRADLRAALRRRPKTAVSDPQAVPDSPGESAAPDRPGDAGEPEDPLGVGPRAVVWAAPGRTWRWGYVDERDPEKPVRLTSNVAVTSREDAQRAARVAYPGVTVTSTLAVDMARAARHRSGTRQARRRRRLIAALWLPLWFLLRRCLRRPRMRPEAKKD